MLDKLIKMRDKRVEEINTLIRIRNGASAELQVQLDSTISRAEHTVDELNEIIDSKENEDGGHIDVSGGEVSTKGEVLPVQSEGESREAVVSEG